jgi:hypothetical protein
MRGNQWDVLPIQERLQKTELQQLPDHIRELLREDGPCVGAPVAGGRPHLIRGECRWLDTSCLSVNHSLGERCS